MPNRNRDPFEPYDPASWFVVGCIIATVLLFLLLASLSFFLSPGVDAAPYRPTLRPTFGVRPTTTVAPTRTAYPARLPQSWKLTSAGTETQFVFVGEHVPRHSELRVFPPNTSASLLCADDGANALRCTAIIDKNAQVAQVLSMGNERIFLIGETLLFYPVVYGSSMPQNDP
jgi:hypothetical protein